MPGWDGYPIRERFAARYGAPVWVDNDVNLLALGEWRSGVAAGHDNVVVIKVGTGIGAGIISDGRLHRGAQGSAGDVGHIQVVDDAVGDLPLRQRRLPRGATPAAPRWDVLVRPPRRRGAARDSPLALDQRGSRQRRGRRAGRVVRRPGRRRAAPVGRPAGRLDAGQRRELLQPVADRHRRRRGQQPGAVPRVDPRDGLPALAAAGDARPAHRSVRRSAGWPASSGRRRWSSTSSSPASRSAAGSRPAIPPPRPTWTWLARADGRSRRRSVAPPVGPTARARPSRRPPVAA